MKMRYGPAVKRIEAQLAELRGYQGRLDGLQDYIDRRAKLEKLFKGSPFYDNVVGTADASFSNQLTELEKDAGIYEKPKRTYKKRDGAKKHGKPKGPGRKPGRPKGSGRSPGRPRGTGTGSDGSGSGRGRPRQYPTDPSELGGGAGTAAASKPDENKDMDVVAYEAGITPNDLAIFRGTDAGEVRAHLSKCGAKMRDEAEDTAAKDRLIRIIRTMGKSRSVYKILESLHLDRKYASIIEKYSMS